jgi:hypothetical protein
MSVKIKVKSNDQVAKVQRKAVVQRVLDYFGSCLPPLRLLCFLDDSDPPDLRRKYGRANRGFYGPIHGRIIRDSETLTYVPDYVTDCIFPDDGVSGPPFPRVIDELIYLYGSTCDNEVALTTILAHELRHAVQHANVRKLWALNGLVHEFMDLNKISIIKPWADIPIEQEARIVSKRVAMDFFGEQRVRAYIDERIADPVTDDDVADWQFVSSLSRASSVDLVAGTKQLLKRLRRYRSELEGELNKRSANDPDFRDIDLSDYF